MEHGLVYSVRNNLFLLMSFSWLFYLFTAQTKGYHFATALSHGKAGYIATGRGYVIEAVSLVSLYAVYAKVTKAESRLHFRLRITCLCIRALTQLNRCLSF